MKPEFFDPRIHRRKFLMMLASLPILASCQVSPPRSVDSSVVVVPRDIKRNYLSFRIGEENFDYAYNAISKSSALLKKGSGTTLGIGNDIVYRYLGKFVPMDFVHFMFKESEEPRMISSNINIEMDLSNTNKSPLEFSAKKFPGAEIDGEYYGILYLFNKASTNDGEIIITIQKYLQRAPELIGDLVYGKRRVFPNMSFLNTDGGTIEKPIDLPIDLSKPNHPFGYLYEARIIKVSKISPYSTNP